MLNLTWDKETGDWTLEDTNSGAKAVCTSAKEEVMVAWLNANVSLLPDAPLPAAGSSK